MVRFWPAGSGSGAADPPSIAQRARRGGPRGREEINLPASKYNGLGVKMASEEIAHGMRSGS
jgi:hypothetical protein